jgi:hypothetical protein
MTEQCGIDSRQRGYFWGPNQLIKDWAPLIGLDGIGLLNTYDVWCDRREGSATQGFAFPSRNQESSFYGESKASLAVITSILEATGLLHIEVQERTTGHGRGGGGSTRTRKNFYRLVNRDWTLTLADVIAVLELADQDKRVFKRIAHIFKPNFAPIDGKNNPWKTILPEVRQHPLWQKLEARAQKRAASYRNRRGKGDGGRPDNRRSLPVTTGSPSEPNQRSLLDTAGSSAGPNRQSLLVTTGKPAEPTVTISDGKHDVEEDDDRDLKDKDVFTLFAALAGHDTYRPSDRDRRALDTLHADGYTLSEIRAGIQRAVAGAKARNTVPNRFGYCVPVIRDLHPANPPQGSPAGEPTPATEQAAAPVVAAPLVTPSSTPAAMPDPLIALCHELGEFAQQRGLDLSDGVLRDLARLTVDFDAAAAQQGSSGLEWVEEALKRVDSTVKTPSRYARAILEDWRRRGCDALLAVQPQSPSPDAEIEGSMPEIAPSPSQPAYAKPKPDPLSDRWGKVLEDLQQEMTQATFNTWLRDTRLFDLVQADEVAIWKVEVRNSRVMDWLEHRLRPTIERVVGQNHPTPTRLEFVLAGN